MQHQQLMISFFAQDSMAVGGSLLQEVASLKERYNAIATQSLVEQELAQCQTRVGEVECELEAKTTILRQREEIAQKATEVAKATATQEYHRTLDAEAEVEHLGQENFALKMEVGNLYHAIDAMAQQLEEVDDREAKIKVCGVEKYKASQGFKKGLSRLGHNSFAFSYELVISKVKYDHPDIKFPEDPA